VREERESRGGRGRGRVWGLVDGGEKVVRGGRRRGRRWGGKEDGGEGGGEGGGGRGVGIRKMEEEVGW